MKETTALVASGTLRHDLFGWDGEPRSRTALEADLVLLRESQFWTETKLIIAQDRLDREMEVSIRLGVELLQAENKIRDLESRLLWAQRKLGHKV